MALRILVIGGGAAGMSAASWARRRDPSAEITVLEKTGFISHAPCGIPYYAGGLFSDRSLLQAYDARFFREARRIEVLLRAEPRMSILAQGSSSQLLTARGGGSSSTGS
ncbi:MAG: hypothetical protein ACP5HK_07615 [Acidilobus sp.]